jgi:transposase
MRRLFAQVSPQRNAVELALITRLELYRKSSKRAADMQELRGATAALQWNY